MGSFKEETRWLVILGFVFCFAMAMAMGANDVANAFGTSVGAGVVTLRQAVVLASVMNLLGATLMSGAVTDTIRKGIVDLERFSDDERDAAELMLLMVCAMVGATGYVCAATARRLPVSTTQAVLGGLVGAMVARDRGSGKGVRWYEPGVCSYARGTGRLSCGGVAGIVLQWVFAPLISMVLATALFLVSKRVLLAAERDVALRRAPPFMAFLLGGVAFALAWFVIVQQQHHPHSRGWDPRDERDPTNRATALEVGACALIAVTASYGALTVFSLYPGALAYSPAGAATAYRRAGAAAALRDVEIELGPTATGGGANPLRARGGSEEDVDPGGAGDSPFDDDADDAAAAAVAAAGASYDPDVERAYGAAQVASASLAAFAAGANDVANEVGPLAAIVQTWADGGVESTARTPRWLFAYAGAGIALGLGLFGTRVMRTIGRDATKMTPARGFNIELGYSLASLIASAEGWPVSTTQLCVGAVVGVGLAAGEGAGGAVNGRLLLKIFASWVLTPLAAGAIAALAFALLRGAL